MNDEAGEKLIDGRDGDAGGLCDIEIGAVLTFLFSLDDQIETAGERFQLFNDWELIAICTHIYSPFFLRGSDGRELR